MQAYSNPKRESDPHSLPDIKIFYVSKEEASQNEDLEQAGYGSCPESGWYWQSCFPGCLPDGGPMGPFATEAEALADAQSDAVEEDDADSNSAEE